MSGVEHAFDRLLAQNGWIIPAILFESVCWLPSVIHSFMNLQTTCHGHRQAQALSGIRTTLKEPH